jgi:hypothetical protein
VELRGLFMSRRKNADQILNMKSANKLFEDVEKFNYLRMAVPNENFVHKMNIKADEIRWIFGTIKFIIIIFSPGTYTRKD